MSTLGGMGVWDLWFEDTGQSSASTKCTLEAQRYVCSRMLSVHTNGLTTWKREDDIETGEGHSG